MSTIEFIACRGRRYVTVDAFARIWEVTNLYNQFGNDTTDPALAESCVIRIDDHTWISGTTDIYPVYSVH